MNKKTETIAILPLGAHEYHGPHLPVTTDAVIAEAFAKQLASRSFCDAKLIALPVEEVGYSIEHQGRPGTKTLSYSAAIERWVSIGTECDKKGIKKLLFLNAHGGNSALMNIVITELRCRTAMLAVATSWGRFGLPEGLISPEEKPFDIHAGFIETSLMLYLRPHDVAMDKAKNFYNRQKDFQQNYKYLRAYGPFAFGWKMRDLNPDGAAGDATKASKEAGKAIFDHALKGFIGLIDDMQRFNVDQLT